jgi:hypothetical protein
MMPRMMTARVERPSGRRFQIRIPVLPVLLVLSPLLILAAAVACLVFRVSMVRTFGAGARIPFALPGTQLDFRVEGWAVLVSITGGKQEVWMNEQRKDILDMLAEGKVTPDEAEQLISALERDLAPAVVSSELRPKGKAKYLRLVVDVTDEDEPVRVNARVPMQLLRAGVRLAALIPPQALAKANAELDRSGVPLDLTQLKPDQLEALVEYLDEVTLEVDSSDAKVRVFCE